MKLKWTPAEKQKFFDLISAEYGEGAIVTTNQVREIREKNNLAGGAKANWFLKDYWYAKGKAKLPVNGELVTSVKPKKLKVPVMPLFSPSVK